MNKKNLILFHGNCPDGVTSAWAAWKVFGDTADYVPVFHPVRNLPDCAGKNVFLLDFSCDREVMIKAHACAESFIVLDHHEGQEAELVGLPFAIFDKSRAGAGLAWDYFHPETPRPAMVNLIEDRDIRKFTYVETDPILHLFDDSGFHQRFDASTTFDQMTEFCALVEADFISFGGYDRTDKRIISLEGLMIPGLERHNKFMALCTNLSANATPVSMFGQHGLAVNCPVPFEDAIATILATRCNGFGVVYHHSPTNPKNVKLSLRSNGQVDVMTIAQKLGGNGHKHASGCQISFAELFAMFSLSGQNVANYA
jgi:hypothetical protein